ncbi:hypothetical protein [Pedobacter panaciterrae]|uniref:hypothetical protein n=1 Tax=Pedobacter panaciterrae TaxID=363849 RepID=UPI002593E921|nr:hypothetical protein [uncultured Pedobacter sp.]
MNIPEALIVPFRQSMTKNNVDFQDSLWSTNPGIAWSHSSEYPTRTTNPDFLAIDIY